MFAGLQIIISVLLLHRDNYFFQVQKNMYLY